MLVRIETSILELNQEEVTAPTHHNPQVCAVGDTLLHHEQSSRTVGDHLPHQKPPVCAEGDLVLLESREEQVK